MALAPDVKRKLRNIAVYVDMGLNASEYQYIERYEDELRAGELNDALYTKRLLDALDDPKQVSTPVQGKIKPTSLSSPLFAKGKGKNTYFPEPKARGKWTSAGGVVIPSFHPDEMDFVYIRKPTGGYGGKKWTLPKGRVDEGESKKDTAVREVAEETGIKAQIVPGGYLGQYRGDFSETHYYLMVRTGGAKAAMDGETEEVRLVSFDTAIRMFRSSGNTRDAKVVEKAAEIVQTLRAKYKGRKRTRRLAVHRVKVPAADYAKELGLEIRPYVDARTKKKDPKRVVLRIPKYKSDKILDGFLQTTGLHPELQTTGRSFHLVVVSARAFKRATATSETAAVKQRWK
jgi:8-oxo-dGTP pyrophosphatase MutT (NUDIX family)